MDGEDTQQKSEDAKKGYELVGDTVLYRVTAGRDEESEMLVKVKVKDYDKQYGQDTFKITPVAGNGSVWVRDIIEQEDNVRM